MSTTKLSLNPLNYSASQIAKFLVSVIGSLVIILGLAAVEFADGPLAQVGVWAAVAAAFLTPIGVFLKRATPVIETWENSDRGAHEADA
ncbi:hypothetical protein [Rhodococcus opacus]|uniref:Uncharacterized protein n=1 Tax=Rhodococcus opacus (strain B4) TaxID=632772 RepID=C1B9E8_RHOOB|nr:hypothetical protein [Rhodococcus opacus]BAH52301.1 hypothetical protein ROP_40540 [Rhodococcus opacus B4]